MSILIRANAVLRRIATGPAQRPLPRAIGAVALAVLLLTAGLLGLISAPAADAGSCRYLLGFAALHDQIPDVVGPCVDDETHNPTNGDGLQRSTNGLLVWRKSDNWTAFTNGSQSWVSGPFGLQQRLNGQRFSWEENPERLPIVPAPVAGERCHTAGLSLTLAGVDAGAGNFVGSFVLANNTGVSCTFYGFPGAQLLDGQSNPLPTKVVRGGGYMANQPGPSLITVPAGGSAGFKMHWEQVPVGNETSCAVSSYLQVTPPDEYDPLVIPAQIRACGGGQLDVSAVQPIGPIQR